MPTFVELNRAIFKRFLSAHWPTLGGMGLNGFLFLCPLTRAWDPKRQFWPIRMKLREPFHRQLFRYAENLLYELLSNIHRTNCPTPVGCTKIRPLTCCVISLAQYTYAHELFCDITNNRCLPFLPTYHYPCNASASKGAASTISMPLIWRGYDSNPRPTAPEADALPLELSGPVDR